MTTSSSSTSWRLVVHGGAWNIPDDDVEEIKSGLSQALLAGSRVLAQGGTSIDAVEAAVRVLEDAPIFDAGIGSVLNEAGEVEMDAMIMDGRNPLRSGAVVCVQNIRNPVSLARAVMERTSHCMLSGDGAAKFADELIQEGAYKLQHISLQELTTPQAKAQWENRKRYQDVVSAQFNTSAPAVESQHNLNQPCDTVGAVALDVHGNLAAATSTGGISFKKVGRVGDSPIVGSGGYADNESVAVSVTGHGESIAKVNLSARVVFGVEQGQDVNQAIGDALEHMKRKTDGGCGGAIALKKDGTIARGFTTERMAFGCLSGEMKEEEEVLKRRMVAEVFSQSNTTIV